MDSELYEIESLPGMQPPAQQTPQASSSVPADAKVIEESGELPARQAQDSADGLHSQREWVQRDGKAIAGPAPGIPQLPEVEAPSQRALKPLPERAPPSQQSVPDYLKNPPEPEYFGLPDSEILQLPQSGEFFHRPQSGEFFRRPGQDTGEDFAYPDSNPRRRKSATETIIFPLDRLSRTDSESAKFEPGAVPVGNALRELAAALSQATQRMSMLDGAHNDNLEQRIAALRARILTLRERIDNAIALHEHHTREMALLELDRRQLLLEGLLEQASLELAKTYDQRVNH